MRTRPVHTEELDLFIEAGSPEHREEVRRYLKSMFTAGSMRPEWCFVAQEEKEDRPLGRVAFWTLPGMEEPFALVLLDLPWDGDYMGVGTRLLGDVLNEARSLGAKEIEHVLDAPPMRPQFQHSPEERVEMLRSVGFAFRRETGRFEWRGGEPNVEPARLSFRTLEEVGDEAFVEAMRRVSEGTLDREIREERERLGPQRAAREFFEDAQRVDHGPSWLRLAYSRPEGGTRGSGDAGGAARLPDPLLRRRRGGDERTGVHRRPAGRRYRNAPRGSSEGREREAPAGRHRRGQRADVRRLRTGGVDAVRREARVQRRSHLGSCVAHALRAG
jgi:hypothetical protein